MNTTKMTDATRYINQKVILRLIDLARLSFLVRSNAIQYDFQNPRVSIEITVYIIEAPPEMASHIPD